MCVTIRIYIWRNILFAWHHFNWWRRRTRKTAGEWWCHPVCDTSHDLFVCVTHDIFMCDTGIMHVCHDSFVCLRCIHMCDMTHSFVWHHSNWWQRRTHKTAGEWLYHPVCDMTWLTPWHDLLTCLTRDILMRVTWIMHACVMTHSYVWHAFICVTWLFICVTSLQLMATANTQDCRWVILSFHPVCDMTWLTYVCDTTRDIFMRVTWIMHACVMTHSHVWHDSFICVTLLLLMATSNTQDCRWVILLFHLVCNMVRLIHVCDTTLHVCQQQQLFHMRDMTHSFMWHYVHNE